MNVIPLTVFVGLMLVTFFIFLFLYQWKCSALTGPERDSLMPLEDESVRPSGTSHRKNRGNSTEI